MSRIIEGPNQTPVVEYHGHTGITEGHAHEMTVHVDRMLRVSGRVTSDFGHNHVINVDGVIDGDRLIFATNPNPVRSGEVHVHVAEIPLSELQAVLSQSGPGGRPYRPDPVYP